MDESATMSDASEICPACGSDNTFFSRLSGGPNGPRTLQGDCYVCKHVWPVRWSAGQYEAWADRQRQRQVETGQNPLGAPPSANPIYLTSEQAISTAVREENRAHAKARLMFRSEFEALCPEFGENWAPHRDRKVWVVSVRAEAWSRGGRPPHKVDAFTVVIDAESGTVTDEGFGVAALDRPAPDNATRRE
jgi:hypothetical protein